MKIILVTDYFYPTSKGGTEKYVYLLAKHLPEEYDVTILSVGEKINAQEFDGLNIDYISPNTDFRKKVVQGLTPPDNLTEFKTYIAIKRPDIVHFHTLTTNLNEYHFGICFDLGIKTYFTSHISGHQCLRGDFIYHGKTPCDGKVEMHKCISCITLHNKSSFFTKISKYIYYNLSPNNPISLKLKQLKTIESNTNKIIAVCQWQKDFFIKNGISENHLEICRQEVASKDLVKTVNPDKIRLGFIGRVDPVKGLHLLINAMKLIENGNLQLKIAAIPPSNEHQNYYDALKEIAKDVDCSWQFSLDNKQIESFFEQIDYLVIPSIGYETGPFVAYEALAFGTPILATDIGGQREAVIESQSGYLFEPNENSLMSLLKKIVESPIQKKEKIKVYMEESIAQEMTIIYNIQQSL